MIVVGCTLASYRMSGDPRNWMSWLANAEAVMESHADGVTYFAALETDARGLEPFYPLIARLAAVGGTYWTFSLDDKVDVITTGTRLRRICMGHNLVGTFAVEEAAASHVLFLASDTQARDDVLPRLLELDVAAAACHITTYGLGVDEPRIRARNGWHTPTCSARKMSLYLGVGNYVQETPGMCDCGADQWDVRVHMETCACMLLRRDVVRRIKWRFDPDAGTSDDPSMHDDLRDFLHENVYSRHDVLATHYPEAIPPIEIRHSDEERRVRR